MMLMFLYGCPIYLQLHLHFELCKLACRCVSVLFGGRLLCFAIRGSRLVICCVPGQICFPGVSGAILKLLDCSFCSYLRWVCASHFRISLLSVVCSRDDRRICWLGRTYADRKICSSFQLLLLQNPAIALRACESNLYWSSLL